MHRSAITLLVAFVFPLALAGMGNLDLDPNSAHAHGEYDDHEYTLPAFVAPSGQVGRDPKSVYDEYQALVCEVERLQYVGFEPRLLGCPHHPTSHCYRKVNPGFWDLYGDSWSCTSHFLRFSGQQLVPNNPYVLGTVSGLFKYVVESS
jgi:hypothetical protein